MIGKFRVLFGVVHIHELSLDVVELTRENVSLLSSVPLSEALSPLPHCKNIFLEANEYLQATLPSAPTHPNADSNLSPMTDLSSSGRR